MIYNVLNEDDFEQEIQDAADKLVVIDFYANWCGPCKIIDPLLQDLSLQYADKAKFLKVNVDYCEDIAVAHNITSMPTFVFMKNQQIIDILLGGNAEKLVKNIEKYVGDVQPTTNNFNTDDKEDDEPDLQHNVLDDGLQHNDSVLQDEEYASMHYLDDNDELQDDPTAVLEVVVDDLM